LNGFLVDTSIALLAVIEPGRVRPQIKTAIADGPSYLSIISFWEVMIKSCKGLLDVGDQRLWWAETQKLLKLQPLHFTAHHIAAL
jgi:PIN domain nuclease of toxin-antitoxin system